MELESEKEKAKGRRAAVRLKPSKKKDEVVEGAGEIAKRLESVEEERSAPSVPLSVARSVERLEF